MALQPGIAHLIVFGFRMLGTICLNDQRPFKTNKIDDEVPDLLLALELEIGQPVVAQD